MATREDRWLSQHEIPPPPRAVLWNQGFGREILAKSSSERV